MLTGYFSIKVSKALISSLIKLPWLLELITIILSTLIIIAAMLLIHKKRSILGLILALLLIILSNTLSFMNLIVKPIDKTQETN